MADRKKIKKSIESLDKQIKEHKEKVRSYEGVNYALLDYWEKEIEVFQEQKEKKEEKLKKM